MKGIATASGGPRVSFYAVAFAFFINCGALNVDPQMEADLARMLQAPGIHCKVPALKACVTLRRLHATEVKALRLSNASEFAKAPAGDVVEGCEKTWTAQCTAGLCPEVSEHEQHTRASICRQLLDMSWQGPDLWPKRTTPAMPPPPKPKKAAAEWKKLATEADWSPPASPVKAEPKAPKKRRRRRRRRHSGKSTPAELDAEEEGEFDDEFDYPGGEAAIGDRSADDTHYTMKVSEGDPDQLRAAVHDLKKMVVDAYKKGMQAGSKLGGLAHEEHVTADQAASPAKRPTSSTPPVSPATSSAPAQQAAPVEQNVKVNGDGNVNVQPPPPPPSPPPPYAPPQIIYMPSPPQPPQVQTESPASAAAAAAAASAAAAIAASITNLKPTTPPSTILDRHPLDLSPTARRPLDPDVEKEAKTEKSQKGRVHPKMEPAPESVGSKESTLPPVDPPKPLNGKKERPAVVPPPPPKPEEGPPPEPPKGPPPGIEEGPPLEPPKGPPPGIIIEEPPLKPAAVPPPPPPEPVPGVPFTQIRKPVKPPEPVKKEPVVEPTVSTSTTTTTVTTFRIDCPDCQNKKANQAPPPPIKPPPPPPPPLPGSKDMPTAPPPPLKPTLFLASEVK